MSGSVTAISVAMLIDRQSTLARSYLTLLGELVDIIGGLCRIVSYEFHSLRVDVLSFLSSLDIIVMAFLTMCHIDLWMLVVLLVVGYVISCEFAVTGSCVFLHVPLVPLKADLIVANSVTGCFSCFRFISVNFLSGWGSGSRTSTFAHGD